MANTYTQLYVHSYFPKRRHAQILNATSQNSTNILPAYHKAKTKVIQINSMPDHIHILIGMTPDIALSDLMQSIKIGSTRFINRQDWIAGKFQWQEGFGAFSYSRSQLNTVAAYIENQEEHHSRQTFHEEYLEFLKRFNIPYDAKYVFDLETPIKSPRR